ncbi:hypothetical protein FisN_18Lh112 [Fistulifera solaris]|uniref:Uncharacterized protein n=1 Tax=Fistulifera solaris TaxID=1519565 RepID=A0A1Z5KFA4_FISSO|nr:hypothetical protein FisN_18Lh112 [Fistulifera solaris]|eukprot:GAX24805.1 hypothetical protein FisN_18Lh112 [Fistulifera solaris]
MPPRKLQHNINIDDDDDSKPPAVVLTPVSQLDDDHHSLGSISTATTPHTSTDTTRETPRSKKRTKGSTETVSSSLVLSPINERSIVYSEMVLLVGTMVISTATFIYVMVPTTALLSLGVLFSSLYIMGASTLRRLVTIELERLRHTNGLREILPTAVYRFLTEESLHDQLNGESSTREWMYLLLYFLPLPREQLYYYLNRLNPQHVEQLHHRGVGHVILGPEAMQVVMGMQGYAEAQEAAEEAKKESFALVPAESSSTPVVEDEDNDDSVVFNAIWDAFYLSIYTPVASWTSGFVRSNIIRPFTSRILRYGTSLSFLSAGLAFGNFYQRHHGVVSWPLYRQTALHRREDRALYLTAAVSGASVVLALGVRYFFCAPNKKRSKKSKRI